MKLLPRYGDAGRDRPGLRRDPLVRNREMLQHLWRTLFTMAVMLLLTVGGVSLVGCEQEPDNGVQIEGDNGVDVETDAPGD